MMLMMVLMLMVNHGDNDVHWTNPDDLWKYPTFDEDHHDDCDNGDVDDGDDDFEADSRHWWVKTAHRGKRQWRGRPRHTNTYFSFLHHDDHDDDYHYQVVHENRKYDDQDDKSLNESVCLEMLVWQVRWAQIFCILDFFHYPVRIFNLAFQIIMRMATIMIDNDNDDAD